MKRSLIWLFLAMPLFCAAQSNYLNGYIIKGPQDTLRGYVDYQGRIFTPDAVRFKKELDEKTEGYTVENCAGFGIDNKEHFERYTVNVSQAYTRVSNLKEGLDTSFKKETVFLKVLSRGKNVTLFSYTDEIKERFYLKSNKDVVPYELFRAQYLEKNSYSVKGDYRFKNQLLNEMSRHDGVGYYDPKKLDVLRYEQEDLIRVVSVINGQKIKKATSSRLSVFAGTGLSVSNATYTGNHVLANDKAVSKSSYMPMLTAGIDVATNFDPDRCRLVLRLEGAFYSSKNKITSTGNSIHTFDEKAFAVSPQFKYNFYHTASLRIFAGAGVLFNYYLFSNSKAGKIFPPSLEGGSPSFEEQKIQFQSFNMTAAGKIGAVVHKRIEISAAYIIPAKITDYSGFNVRIQRMTFGVNYLFGN